MAMSPHRRRPPAVLPPPQDLPVLRRQCAEDRLQGRQAAAALRLRARQDRAEPHHRGLGEEAARARPGDQARALPRPAALRDPLSGRLLRGLAAAGSPGPMVGTDRSNRALQSAVTATGQLTMMQIDSRSALAPARRRRCCSGVDASGSAVSVAAFYLGAAADHDRRARLGPLAPAWSQLLLRLRLGGRGDAGLRRWFTRRCRGAGLGARRLVGYALFERRRPRSEACAPTGPAGRLLAAGLFILGGMSSSR